MFEAGPTKSQEVSGTSASEFGDREIRWNRYKSPTILRRRPRLFGAERELTGNNPVLGAGLDDRFQADANCVSASSADSPNPRRRSTGPTKTASTPGTDKMSSRFAKPLALSIIGIHSDSAFATSVGRGRLI